MDIRRMAPAMVTAGLLLGVWELVVHASGVPSYLLPPPSAILARWLSSPGFFLAEGGVSLLEALAGLLVGGGVALLAGALMAKWRWVEDALLPLAIAAKVTPVVILAPLFVLWFGFTPVPRILIAALLTFFPVLIGAVAGLRSAPAGARDVLATLDASPADELRLLRFPAALPQLLAVLKVSATLALLGAVVAEWLGGDRGLGRAILLANTNLDTATSLAGVATLAVIGMALVGGLTLLERRLLFWHASQAGEVA